MTSKLVPSKVLVRFGNCNIDWQYYIIRQETWTPFEAACLLNGLRPDGFDLDTGIAVARWDYDSAAPEQLPEHYYPEEDYGAHIQMLCALIENNAGGSESLVPKEIVEWALKSGVLSSNTELARYFFPPTCCSHRDVPGSRPTDFESNDVETKQQQLLDENARLMEQIQSLENECYRLRGRAKATGKHFAERRERFIGAALNTLAKQVTSLLNDPKLKRSAASALAADQTWVMDQHGKVIAARLADAISDRRVFYGFDDDDKRPSMKSMSEGNPPGIRGAQK